MKRNSNNSSRRKLGATMMALFIFGAALAGSLTPFKGSGTGTVIGVIPQQTYVELTIAGSGQSTHFGRFSRLEVLQVTNSGGVTGTIVFTAASGDTVSVSVVGQFVSQTTVLGTYTIISGTGRFAGRTGGANFIAVSADGIHLTFEFDGSIS